jgi:MtN3 and saliva related transmembrane protein
MDVTATTLGFVAATWGIVMALAPVLQIHRILRNNSSRDVSIGYLAVLVVGFALWIVYGAAIGNPALVVPNTAALVTGITTIGIALRYRGRE